MASAVAGQPIEMAAQRLAWTKKSKWLEELADKQTCKLVSASEPRTCRFETTEGGRYRVQRHYS